MKKVVGIQQTYRTVFGQYSIMEVRRKSISLKDKYSIVICISKGDSQSVVARKYGLAKSTVSGIWKKRTIIMREYERKNGRSIMRLRSSQHSNIEKKLYTWYRTRINAKLPVNGQILKDKASEIAKSLGEEFKCTSKWLDKFKSRYGILFKRSNVDPEEECLKHNFWPNVSAGFVDDDIFTVREIGIFFKSFPDEKLDLCCNNGEFANSRLTLCICANMRGTEKRPLLIIGNKRCNVKVPVKYKCNKKCWMNLDLSLEELTFWNKELVLKNRKILLLVKFSPAFRKLTDFSHVKIGFYSNDISTHPLDMAASKLKYFYRKYLLEIKEYNGVVNRMQCIRLLYKSWLRVSSETISNGFQILNGHCQVKKLSLVPWALKKGLSVAGNLDECLTFDNNLVTSVHFLSDAAGICDSLETVEFEESDEEEIIAEIDVEKALEMAQILTRFIENKGDKILIEYMVKIEHFLEDSLESLLNLKLEDVKAESD